MIRWRATAGLPGSLVLAFIAGAPLLRASDTNWEEQLRSLREQNTALQQQVQKQGDVLDGLTRKVKELEAARTEPEAAASENPPGSTMGGFNLGKVNISGEGGVAFFNTGSEGLAPHSEFRVDEARLFVEAPIWKEVYFYGEADLATRENTGLNLALGELYLDFQDVSQWWGKDNQLNVRAGRMDIPFGEEYLTRNVIDDPLISRSLPDLWGMDPGVELYGSVGKFSYVVAVQNGSGANGVQDFDGDKSVAGRIGYDPARWLHFSVSGMRTGDLSVAEDGTSALWFGNGLFHSIGTTATTTTFDADLVEGDLSVRWSGGHLSAFGGYARYDDNDTSADNGRDIFYYSVEGVQQLPRKFYTAVRFSEILAADGYPILGYGNYGTYHSSPTTELWRASLGLGYRFSDRLVLKTEYSFERGKDADGNWRHHEDFFGTEAAFQF